jgi:hypothetical protein
MERMEHFRHAKVLEGEAVVLDDVEGHLGFHEKAHGRKQWHGYFELGPHQHLKAGSHYELQLADGRHAEINAADVPASERAGAATHIADFYVVGEVRSHRRGLRDDGGRKPVLG